MSVPDASSVTICLITNDFGPRAGGIETFVIGLLERLTPHRCIVYTSRQGETASYDERWFREYGVEVIRDKSRVLLPTPRVIAAINLLIRREGVTHLWFGAAAPLALMTPILKRANRKERSLRTFALTHGHEVWWAKIPPFSLLMRIIGAGLDSIGFLTGYTRDEISKGLRKNDRGKLVQVAPGIDVDLFKPVTDTKLINEHKDQLGLKGKQVIISVGRLVHRKGQDQLIKALALLLPDFSDLHLLLVGEGPYEKDLRSLVARHSLNDAVTFVGRVQLHQLPIYLSVADLFAMPSRDRLGGLEVEGLGIVYLEASSCGLPVVVGNSGGAPDAVIEGKTGLIVDGNDVKEIAEACRRLLADPQRAREMGTAGREWVTSHWRWDRWAEEFRAALLR